VISTAARAADEIGQRSAVARGARDGALRRLLAAGDAVSVLIALAIALQISPMAAGGHSLVWGLVVIPLMLVLFKLYGLYDRDVKRIGRSTVDDLPHLLHATLVGGLVLWVYARQTPLHRLDLLEILTFGVLVLVLAPLARSTVRRNASRLIGRDRALLVGGGAMAETLVGKLRAHPEYGLEVAGVLV
jgi:FlaA1/EpsC-like NDP-sugar epimerase